MYFIRAGDSLLYDPRVDGLKVVNPKLDLECNKAGTASFIMYPDHPLYDAIIKLKTIITIYRDNELIFRGRVLNDDIDFNKAKKLSLEGELAFFNDSVVRPYTFTGSIKDYLKLLLDSHNGQVDADKQFKLGNVTVTDPNDYIPRSDTTYPTTWSLLDSKLVGSLGGYLIVRHEPDGNYLDYLADSSYIAQQSIELGDNLLDLTRVNKGEDIATGIIPLGKAIDDEDPDTTDLRLTIASVNGGKDYLVDETAAAIYGRVFKTVTYDDVTIAANLLSKGKQDLAQSIKTLQTITIKAIDKYMTNVDITAFRAFEYVKVTSKPHGIEQSFLITKLSIDLENPKNNTMTTGADVSSFINKQSNDAKTLQEIKYNYVKGEQIVSIKQEQKTQASLIDQLPEQILTQVSEDYASVDNYNDFKESIETTMTQTAEQFEFKFSNITEWINRLDDEIRKVPTLLNGWTDYNAATFTGASYWKDVCGVVHLAGLIKGGTVTNGTVLFTLPAGYRPFLPEIMSVQNNDGIFRRLDVMANGDVVLKSANYTAVWISLASITFKAEK